MERAFLRIGDMTTAGGEVTQGFDMATHHGERLTYIGASVYCPACKSEGYIVPTGERLPMDFMGKTPALHGDLCLCQCTPPPAVLASQSTARTWVSPRVKYGDGATILARASPPSTPPAPFDEHFQLVDATTGAPLPGVQYRALTKPGALIASGVTDREGRTAPISTPRGETIKLQMREK